MHYAQDLGFEYLTASTKEEYVSCLPRFLTKELTNRPMLFEIFTEPQNESDALETVKNLDVDTAGAAKTVAKKILGRKGTVAVKKLLGKE